MSIKANQRQLWIVLSMITASPQIGCGSAQEALRSTPMRKTVWTTQVDQPSADESEVMERELLDRRLAALQRAPGSMDIAADVNARPIRVWFARGLGGIRSIYVIGHADPSCCPVISRVVQQMDFTHLKLAWISFGFTQLEAKDEQGAAALLVLQQDIERHGATQTCAGQVLRTTLEYDAIRQRSYEVVNLGVAAVRKAQELGRPIILWHHFPDNYPLLVPPVVLDRDGRARELEIRVPLAELQVPLSLFNPAKSERLASEISRDRAEVSYMDAVIAQPELAFGARGQPVEVRSRSAELEEKLIAAARGAEALRAKLTRIKGGSLSLSKHVRLLDEVNRKNEQALRTLRALPAVGTVSRPRRIIMWESVPDPALIERYRSERSQRASRIIKTERNQQALAAIELAPFVDALLRGWPATSEVPAGERDFDRWISARQVSVWSYIRKQLVRAGIIAEETGNGAVRTLQMSNVIFQIRQAGEDVLLRPYFILTDKFLQVAESSTGLVRYEAAAAYQNLSEITTK